MIVPVTLLTVVTPEDTHPCAPEPVLMLQAPRTATQAFVRVIVYTVVYPQAKEIEDEIKSLDDPAFIDRAGQWVRKD